MAERDYRRVEIGFAGGGGVSMRITEEDYDQLRKALTEGSGDRWHQLDARFAEFESRLTWRMFAFWAPTALATIGTGAGVLSLLLRR